MFRSPTFVLFSFHFHVKLIHLEPQNKNTYHFCLKIYINMNILHSCLIHAVFMCSFPNYFYDRFFVVIFIWITKNNTNHTLLWHGNFTCYPIYIYPCDKYLAHLKKSSHADPCIQRCRFLMRINILLNQKSSKWLICIC